jgi:hypothetical protein
MSPRRHSADLRGRRHDLGIGVRDIAAGLGIGLGRRLLRMEDGTATDEDKTFYRTWLSRIARAYARCRFGQVATSEVAPQNLFWAGPADVPSPAKSPP